MCTPLRRDFWASCFSVFFFFFLFFSFWFRLPSESSPPNLDSMSCRSQIPLGLDPVGIEGFVYDAPQDSLIQPNTVPFLCLLVHWCDCREK
ncbi:hypothetical protein LY78DRAFT_494618 [Colletotrichum sublineola]|nr:hypothetical protein LY78DRAFT_494618 [Colletotrichum sublineola]